MSIINSNEKDNLGNILLMDDEERIHTVSKRSFTRLGYRLHSACNGEEALAIYKRQMGSDEPIDLVILDISVDDGMGGAETMWLLQRIDPEVKAFISSGYCNDPMMTSPEEHGFAGALAKPYRMAELRESIQSALGKD